MEANSQPGHKGTPRILVTGDTGPDFDIYLPGGLSDSGRCSGRKIMRCSAGGAGIAFRVLTEAAGGKEVAFELAFKHPPLPASPTVAVWEPREGGGVLRKSASGRKVWRMVHPLNLGELDGPPLPEPPYPAQADADFQPDVILVDDNGCSFRHPRGERKDPLPWEGNRAAIVWKMSAPVCHGQSWWNLVEAEAGDRLIIVVNIDDLRSESVRISQRISWERTALELAGELSRNPDVADLRRASQVVVTLQNAGALWMRRDESPSPHFTLFFDPAHMENEWAEAMGIEGHAYGYSSTFAAALAARIAHHGGKGG